MQWNYVQVHLFVHSSFDRLVLHYGRVWFDHCYFRGLFYVVTISCSTTVLSFALKSHIWHAHLSTQDSENIPSPDLDTFLTTLSSLRSNFGVPISIILMQCTPGGLENRLCTLRQPAFYGCGQGDGGVMQCVLRMPLLGDQFGKLVELQFHYLLSFSTSHWPWGYCILHRKLDEQINVNELHPDFPMEQWSFVAVYPECISWEW